MVKIVKRETPPSEASAGLAALCPNPHDTSSAANPSSSEKEDAADISETMKRYKSRRRVAACVVGLTVVIGLGGQYQAPDEAFAQKPTLKPVRKAKCSPNTRLLFTLQGSRTVRTGKKEKFVLTAKRCPGKSKKPLRQIKIVGHNTQGQVIIWKIKRLPKGEKRRKTMQLSFPEVDQGKKGRSVSTKPKVVVNASEYGGKHVGSSQWQLKKRTTSRKFAPPTPVGENEPCTPRPDFRTGIQDDEAFVWQKYGSREDAFKLARQAFPDVNILRINLLYDDVKTHGYQPYIDTVIAAKKYGFGVYATLMPTPAYRPEGDQTLSHANENPGAMRLFAKEAAAALGPDVEFIEIGNEPQHPLFSAFLNLDHYKKMAVAGLDGVRSSNKNVKVIFGGLAPNEPSSIIKWLSGLHSLDDDVSEQPDGVSEHPYGTLINETRHIINEVKQNVEAKGKVKARPLYLSEYGNNRGPSQMTFNGIAAERARCAGAAALIYYLLYDQEKTVNDWHTGIYPVGTPPPA